MSEDLLGIEDLVDPATLEPRDPDEEESENEDQREIGVENAPAEQEESRDREEEGNLMRDQPDEARDLGGEQDEETGREQRVNLDREGQAWMAKWDREVRGKGRKN